MNAFHTCAATLLVAAAFATAPQPASAARFDGNWNMVAVTTKGHCGSIYIGLNVKRGRLSSTSGWFAFYPINVSGSVSHSGRVKMKAIAGPRLANGTGRFKHGEAGGKWNGTGPSGLCSGYWSAKRF